MYDFFSCLRIQLSAYILHKIINAKSYNDFCTIMIMKPFNILLIDPGMKHSRFENNHFVNRGLLSIATFLKYQGVSVNYFTFDEWYMKNIMDFQTIYVDLKKVINDSSIQVVGLSNIFIAEFPNAINILQEIKADFPQIITILGGYIATFDGESAIERYPFIDYVIRGEGEWTLLNLLNYLKNDKKDVEPLSVVYRNSQGSAVNTPAPPLGDLNDLPPLDYRLLPGKYLNSIPSPNINIEFNRGCYYSCSFCSVSLFWKGKRREHNYDKIIKELEQLSALNYKGKISFEDDTIDLKSESFKNFLHNVKSIPRQYSFEYAVTRYDFIDQESLKLLRELGCNEIILGLESGSEKLLKTIDKKINLKAFKKVCNLIKDNGVNLNVFLIVGLPGETEETFSETLAYITELDNEELISNLFVSHFQPYPCTKALKDLKALGGRIIVPPNEYSSWILRSKPLVEYPHLSRKRLSEMFSALNKFNDSKRSNFVEKF